VGTLKPPLNSQDLGTSRWQLTIEHFRDGNCASKAELASHTTAGQSLVLPNGKISHRKVPKRIIQTDDIALPARRSNFRGRSAGRTTMPGQEVKRN
jgi:hypothetical protein